MSHLRVNLKVLPSIVADHPRYAKRRYIPIRIHITEKKDTGRALNNALLVILENRQQSYYLKCTKFGKLILGKIIKLLLFPVLGRQPAGDMSHKPGGRLLLLSARPAVTPASLKKAATNFGPW